MSLIERVLGRVGRAAAILTQGSADGDAYETEDPLVEVAASRLRELSEIAATRSELCMGCCAERPVKTRLTLDCGHETEVARLRRVHEENLKVVLLYQDQRDFYKDAFLSQGRDHAAAQGMLESALSAARMMVGSAVKHINDLRKERGQEPLAFAVKPGDPPVGVAAQFQATLDAVTAAAPVDLEKQDPPVGLPPVST